MALFDRYLIVDWSGASVPTTGKDSIWVALHDGQKLVRLENPSTRFAAMEIVQAICINSVATGQRLFAGFDFAFCWPEGAVETLLSPLVGEMSAQQTEGGITASLNSAPSVPDGTSPPQGAGRGLAWQILWHFLAQNIQDTSDNTNNAFELARQLNENGAPFWGHPHQHSGRYPGLGPKKPETMPVKEWRAVECVAKGAKSVWQLAYNGAVGRQSLLGIHHLQKLREQFADKIAVWPFEATNKPIILAEIYPSLFNVKPNKDEVLDEAQMRTLADQFAALDAIDAFKALLKVPDDDMVCEEGWIVGACLSPLVGEMSAQQTEGGIAAPLSSLPSVSKETSPSSRRRDGFVCRTTPQGGREGTQYLRNPDAIYTQSFATIEAEVDLSRYSNGMRAVVTRLIHACGMTDLVDDLAYSDGAAEAGLAALQNDCTIYCDVEMVRSGIIQKQLLSGVVTHCTLNDPRAAVHGKAMQNTRSAAAVDFWGDLDGSICVIGNAPTALFRLLERIDEGAGKPALIIGIPVGFVGAVESKEALAANPRGCHYITVHGRRGGSAMASSVVNALAGLV